MAYDPLGPAEELANKIRAGFRQLLSAARRRPRFGRTLPRQREVGLVDVAADAYFPVASPTTSELGELPTVRQIQEQLIAQGLATGEELEQHLKNLRAGQLDCATAPMISAWGQNRRAAPMRSDLFPENQRRSRAVI